MLEKKKKNTYVVDWAGALFKKNVRCGKFLPPPHIFFENHNSLEATARKGCQVSAARKGQPGGDRQA